MLEADVPIMDQKISALAKLFVERRHCDNRAIERARQVSLQTGQRLDSVLSSSDS
jgi:hypothetical protein